uniref:Uncharacterized protein n=2 Tax=Triticum urartu TaxID=4572 RepID=A0A8R7JYK6_TRIUA
MALRTRRRSRPLSVRPAPSRTEKDAAARSRYMSCSCGGTHCRSPRSRYASPRSSDGHRPAPALPPPYSGPRILDQSGMLTGSDAGPPTPPPPPAASRGAAARGLEALEGVDADRARPYASAGGDDASAAPPQMMSASSSSRAGSAACCRVRAGAGAKSRCADTMERLLLRPAIVARSYPADLGAVGS